MYITQVKLGLPNKRLEHTSNAAEWTSGVHHRVTKSINQAGA